jgi:putative Mg2+ transporter-C (MgtC) family protein
MDRIAMIMGLVLESAPVESAGGVVLPEHLDIGLRLLAAAVMGGLIGWERGRAEKPADARTMMLIAVGAAGFVLVGARVLAESEAGGVVQADPNRVLSYVVSGVGFLGAGAILHSKKAVLGLTTAASVWCTAAVGAAAGLGEYAVGAIVTLIVLVTLWTPWLYHEARGTKPKENGARAERAPQA